MGRALASHFEHLLDYHGWAYQRLMASLEVLDEADYKAPRGLFFGSIHGTLNHLAIVDRLWLARVRREPPPYERLDIEADADRAALAALFEQGVQAWRSWIAGEDDSNLTATLRYRNVAGEPHSRVLGDIVAHLINHGTHHRGQISAALTAMGQPGPVLDYIYFLPDCP